HPCTSRPGRTLPGLRLPEHSREAFVTLGPDLDWLATPEGDLRPEVAEELMHGPAPAPQPPTRQVERVQLPPRRDVRRRVHIQAEHRQPRQFPRTVLPIALAALVGVLIGTQIPRT